MRGDFAKSIGQPPWLPQQRGEIIEHGATPIGGVEDLPPGSATIE